jgi:cytochrome c556
MKKKDEIEHALLSKILTLIDKHDTQLQGGPAGDHHVLLDAMCQALEKTKGKIQSFEKTQNEMQRILADFQQGKLAPSAQAFDTHNIKARLDKYSELSKQMDQQFSHMLSSQQSKIKELEQFTAAEGQFVQTVDFERDAKYLPSFLKGERVVASVQGNVDATVDFGGLDQDAVKVSDDRRTITLRLPAPELQPADIEESSTKILTRDRGILDRTEDFFASSPTDDTPLSFSALSRSEMATLRTRPAL